MKLQEITPEALREHVISLENGYTLFEAELLQDNDYDLKAKSLAHELPEALSASKLINEVDPHTIDTHIWDDTQFEDFKNIGPIINCFHTGSKLIEKYLSLWGDWHVGVFIDALSEDALISHLRSLLLVNIPEDGEVHYRFQETRKLAGILESMDSEERLSELLGPIKKMMWQQNCGADKSYFCIENPNPHETFQDMGWFSFTPSEIQKINEAELLWFKRSIVSTVLKTVEEDAIPVEHLKKHKEEDIERFLENGYEMAQKKAIYSEDGLRFFLINSLYYPDFMNSKDAARILAQEHWVESKKLNNLKEMLESYTLEHDKQNHNK